MYVPQPPSKARLVFITTFAFALLVVLYVVSLVGSGVSTASLNSNHLPLAPSSAHEPSNSLNRQVSVPLATSTPGCGPAWSVVPSPNTGASDSLNGVAALSSADVWAVGDSITGTHHTLTEHWNGTTWSTVPSPNLDQYSSLNGIAAISSSDVWAVGYGTLIEHWERDYMEHSPKCRVGFSQRSSCGIERQCVGRGLLRHRSDADRTLERQHVERSSKSQCGYT